MRVLVFGDSITYGAWDTESGWVERIKRDAHRKTVESEGKNKIQIINLGIGGDTSTKILKRMSVEIKARYSKNWPLIFIISFGTNDERSINGVVETSIEQFEDNIREIIMLAKQYSHRIFFVGAPPIGEHIVKFKGQEYSDERLKEYEKSLQNTVEQGRATFIPIRPIFELEGVEKLYTYDKIHPNDRGHELIANAVKPILENNLVD